MEQASGPPAQAPAPPAEDAAPATRADLRWLRRWIAVAAVWAIAATAVAIIALVGRRSDTGKTAHLRSDLSRVESDLGGRISSLEAQLRNLPKAQDVSNLQTRLRKVEKDTTKASADAKKAKDDVSSLKDRVKTLEQSSSSSGTTTTPSGKKKP